MTDLGSDEVHERVQEALAAYVIHAVDPDELAQTEALLGEHLSRCERCASAFRDLEAAAAMVALAASPVQPPATVWHRIRREVRRPSSTSWVALVAVAAVAAAVVSLVGWNVTLAGRMGRTERRQATSAQVIAAVSHPSSRVVPLASSTGQRAIGPRLALAYVPGESVLYVFGTLPEPPDGHVYELWLGRGGRFVGVATFVPEAGEVLLKIRANPFRYDSLVITVEPEGGSRTPSQKLAEASL